MIKVLHAADLHLGTRFAGLPDDKAALLRKEQRKLLVRMQDLCAREGVQLVLLPGDLFENPRPDRDSVDALLTFTEEVRVPVLIAPGNHDYLCSGSPWRTEPWPRNVHIFRKAELEKVEIQSLGVTVWGAGYESIDCPGLMEDFQAQGEGIRIMILHGDPISPGSPNCPVTRAQVRSSGLDYLAMGHIHRAGGFQADRTFCAWPGCTMGRGYDETGRKGVILAEVEVGHVESRLVNLWGGSYEDVTVNCDGDVESRILETVPGDRTRCICRVTLAGDEPEPSAEYLQKTLSPHFFHLELRDRRRRRTPQRAEDDTLEGTFFRLLRESMAGAGPEEQEILQLAARISRDILEGREVELP